MSSVISYADAGVNVAEADRGISRMTDHLKRTWTRQRVVLDIGYFANIVDCNDGTGLVGSTDGVGSKTIICDMMNRYDTIGIDCVAMNVNDVICVGARPIFMVDYIAMGKIDERVLERIGVGLAEGAMQAGISIIGGETSQLPGMVNGFDLVGACTGKVRLGGVITGNEVAPDDKIIGLESNGIHANGMTMARKVLFRQPGYGSLDVNTYVPELGRSVGDELLRPTFIYVNEILDLLCVLPAKALIHITGDGLLNLLRIDRTDIGFVIDNLPEPPAIFKLIQDVGSVTDATMFETFNMGIGFCVVVAPEYVDLAMRLLERHQRKAWVIGETARDFRNTVYIPKYELKGVGKSFERVPPVS